MASKSPGPFRPATPKRPPAAAGDAEEDEDEREKSETRGQEESQASETDGQGRREWRRSGSIEGAAALREEERAVEAEAVEENAIEFAHLLSATRPTRSS